MSFFSLKVTLMFLLSYSSCIGQGHEFGWEVRGLIKFDKKINDFFKIVQDPIVQKL